MNNNDKIPIGKYEWTVGPERQRGGYIKVKFKEGVEDKVYSGDIITLDMIEPYESEAVRKVANYLNTFMFHPTHTYYREETMEYYLKHAKEIVALVHEAEDADE